MKKGWTVADRVRTAHQTWEWGKPTPKDENAKPGFLSKILKRSAK